MTDTDLVSTLNTLIETCRDGERGFREAAESLNDSSVKSLFSTIAQERGLFAEELKQIVRRIGGEPETGGSISGAAHRGWMHLKEAITGHDDKSLIAEAERGEDIAVAAYRRALKSSLPTDVQHVVEHQYSRVQAAHDRVSALKHGRQ